MLFPLRLRPLRRGHSLVEMLAVIGVVSFIMWMIVGVFDMSANIRRGVKNETDAIKATSRLSREFRSDVHSAAQITWSEGLMIPEFKTNSSNATLGSVVSPAYDATDRRIMPPTPARGRDRELGEPEKFDSPPEPEALTVAEKTAAKKKRAGVWRRATKLKLTMRNGDIIQYQTTPAGLERRVVNAKDKLIRRNITRLAPAAFATLRLEKTNGRPLAVLLLNYPVPKSQRHRDELSPARQMRIEAVAYQMETR